MAFKVGVVIVCAGEGKRLGKVDKAKVLIDGTPLYLKSIQVFKGIKPIKKIVLVLRKKHLPLAKKKINDPNVILVEGGNQRKDSVSNGISALDKNINYVLIHDGARPFVRKALIKAILDQLHKYPAVICGIRSPDTLKIVRNSYVKSTLDRRNIFLIQTPQGFKKSLLLKAYKKIKNKAFTDDAQLLEFFGKRVKVVSGEISNFKITYPQDVKLARAIDYEKL